MASEFTVRGDGDLDFLALGALVCRLDPGVVPFRKADAYRVHVSGGEFNVAAALADCFGLRAGIATARVDYPIGDFVAERVRAMGVRPYYRVFEHDGVRGPNIATVYSDLGQGVRAPMVFYNRANEAAALLRPGDFDWSAIFAGGVRWFHSGGIFAALSESTAELIIEAAHAARASGATVSFDLNYRAKLWQVIGGQDRARSIIRRIVENVDVLVGNEEDLQRALGIPGPDVATHSTLDPSAFLGMIDRVLEQHPQIRVIATTLREVHSAGHHSWSAVAWVAGQAHVAPVCELDVFDRVGGETGSRPDSSTGSSAGRRRTRPCGSGGRMGRSSRPFWATPRWQRSTRSGASLVAGPPGSSGRIHDASRPPAGLRRPEAPRIRLAVLAGFVDDDPIHHRPDDRHVE